MELNDLITTINDALWSYYKMMVTCIMVEMQKI